MLKNVMKTIKKHQMLNHRDKVIIGLSGGADSVALLDVLYQLKDVFQLQLYAVHINHGIRGDEAFADSEYCRQLCEKMSIPFIVQEYNIPQIAKEMKLSEEEAGRTMRYKAFQQVLDYLHADKIAVAHHCDDNAETVIMRLCRGTGIQGLCGIPPVRGNIIRPLINCSREDIESYLNQKAVRFVTDSSNLEDDYTRNRIRHHILPGLKQGVNHNAAANIAKAAELLSEENDFMQQFTSESFQRCIVSQSKYRIELDTTIFSSLHPAIKKRMIRLAMEAIIGHTNDISRQNIEDFIGLFLGETGKSISLPHNLQAEKQYTTVVLKIKTENTAEFNYTIGTEPVFIAEYGIYISATEKQDETADESKCFYIDKETALVVRNRKNGDRMCINQNGQSKKIKDILINLKVPKEKRSCIPVICAGTDIVWLYPYRTCSIKFAGEKCKKKIYINIWKSAK